MKKVFYIFIIILLAGLFQQSPAQTDSLERALEAAPDSSRPEILNSLAAAWLRKNPRLTIQYTNRAIPESRRERDIENLATAYYYKGSAYYYLSDYDSSQINFGKSLAEFRRIDHAKGIANALLYHGHIFDARGNIDSALKYYGDAREIFSKSGDTTGIGNTHLFYGHAWEARGKLDEALKYYKLALAEYEKINYERGITSTLNNIGLLYTDMGRFDDAIEYYMRALRKKEEIGDRMGMSYTLNNIGAIYFKMQNYEKAEESYSRALEIKMETSDRAGIAKCLNNLGLIYIKKDNYEKALEMHSRAYEIATEIGNPRLQSNSASRLGSVYEHMRRYAKALSFYEKALSIEGEGGDRYLLATQLARIGNLYTITKRPAKAIPYLERALRITQEEKYRETEKECCKFLSDAWAASGNYARALEYHKRFSRLNDSLFNEQSSQTIAEMQVKYETDKKEKENELLRKSKIINELELDRQSSFIKYLIIIAALTFGLGIVVYNRYRNKRRANQLLSEKNAQIEQANDELNEKNIVISEKNRHIMESITYAEKIQKAVVPDESVLRSHFADGFILFRPKDVVSGDFFWMYQSNGFIFAAAVDCTGHGVPGAFMSMIGNTILNQLIKEQNLTDPARILDELHERVREALNQETEGKGTQDGMDLCLCRIDQNSREIVFAGAKRPLWMVNNSEFSEIAGNRLSIGGIRRKDGNFENKSVNFDPGSIIYLSTDGYPDQANSERKKFGSRRLKELLSAISAEDMPAQKETLERELESHQGDEPQRDDITLVGIKLG
ncbi:MAG: tetratricopeptide repeat protein [Candidatus Kapaibacterium sp.]